MEIKRAGKEDFPRLREIYFQARRERFFWLDPRDIKPEDFDSAVFGEDIYGAWIGGELAGFLTVWAPDRFLHLLFVDQRFRGRGVGGELVRTAARNYGLPLTLKCVKANRQAVEFYLAHGWRIKEEALCPEGPYYLMEYDKD